jgi:hypothetical protein
MTDSQLLYCFVGILKKIPVLYVYSLSGLNNTVTSPIMQWSFEPVFEYVSALWWPFWNSLFSSGMKWFTASGQRILSKQGLVGWHHKACSVTGGGLWQKTVIRLNEHQHQQQGNNFSPVTVSGSSSNRRSASTPFFFTLRNGLSSFLLSLELRWCKSKWPPFFF